jgi:hypothetical protein
MIHLLPRNVYNSKNKWECIKSAKPFLTDFLSRLMNT